MFCRQLCHEYPFLFQRDLESCVTWCLLQARQSRAHSPPSRGNVPAPPHRWGIWSWQGWDPCTRLSSRQWGTWALERSACPASEIQLSSRITCSTSLGRLGRASLTTTNLHKRTSSSHRNLSPLWSKSPFAAKVQWLPLQRYGEIYIYRYLD